jgi:hypothetical protein
MKPAAVRQRRSRQKRRAGLQSDRIYVPTKKVEVAIRKREKLAPDAVVSMQFMIRELGELVDWWVTNWTNLQRRSKVTSDN